MLLCTWNRGNQCLQLWPQLCHFKGRRPRYWAGADRGRTGSALRLRRKKLPANAQAVVRLAITQTSAIGQTVGQTVEQRSKAPTIPGLS